MRPEQSLAVAGGLFASAPDIAWAAVDYGVVFSSSSSSTSKAIAFSRIDRANGAILGLQHVIENGTPCTPAVRVRSLAAPP